MADGAVRVHILSLGQALCRFSSELPRRWPEEHRWVRPDEKQDATCPACLEIATGNWVPVETWQELHVANAILCLEERPAYCDRGRFLLKVFPFTCGPLDIDEADGFPRYYFSEQRAKAEIADWLAARGVRFPGTPEWRYKAAVVGPDGRV